MCLFSVNIPKKKEGIGYKLVRRGEKKGEYLPYWGFRDKNGMGAMTLDNLAVPVKAIYKLNETFEADPHIPKNKAESGRSYKAGVHHYKTLGDLICMETIWDVFGTDYAVIQCEYSKAVAEDDLVVVAMKTKPIRELPLREIHAAY